MSSASIQSEINSCSDQIALCRQQIRELEDKIEEQEFEQRRFLGKRSTFEESLSKHINQRQTISSLAGRNTLAERYIAKTEEHFSKSNRPISKLEDIAALFKKEISDNYVRLDELKTKLRQLQMNLESLQSAYSSALQQEEAERQAAAAAAVAATIRKK